MLVRVLVLVSQLFAGRSAGLLIPPVDAPVVDHFRTPACEWCAGNRGIDYDVAPGTEVRAASAGSVTFAGRVGNDLFVVVGHSGNLRTTYAYVGVITVTTGQRVAQGDIVALSGTRLHFGLRLGRRYLDPELYFGSVSVPTRPRLRPAAA